MEKIRISVCFCGIPLKKLLELVRRRFVEGIPTLELMKELKSKEDREYLATIALLDVPKENLMQAVEAQDPSLLEHLLSCRMRVEQILRRRRIRVKESEERTTIPES